MQVQETVEFLNRSVGNFGAKTAVILGSGLGEFADAFPNTKVAYEDIPNFKPISVVGHKGRMAFCTANDKKVIMLQGRYHFYEGHSMDTVTFPIKVLKALGIENLILTNAAGSINKAYGPGTLMLIKDHINLMGTNPLIGKNNDELGPRFPDMSEVYKKELMQVARTVAKDFGINFKQGVYAAVTGPSYETPSEVNMLRLLGADAVGMSTVPEAIVANHCGMKVLGISCLTNFAAGILEKPLNHSEVVSTAEQVKDDFIKLLTHVVKNIS